MEVIRRPRRVVGVAVELHVVEVAVREQHSNAGGACCRPLASAGPRRGVIDDPRVRAEVHAPLRAAGSASTTVSYDSGDRWKIQNQVEHLSGPVTCGSTGSPIWT